MIEAPGTRPDVRPLKRSEYDQLVELGAFEDEHVELLEGMLVVREPQAPYHAGTLHLLAEALRDGVGSRATVRTQQPLAISDTSEPEPDIAVVPKGRYQHAHPTSALLLVEVTATSLRRDKTWKGRLYAGAGVPEYWLVDLKRRRVTVHRSSTARGWRSRREYGVRDTLSPLRFPEIVIPLADVFGD